MTYCTAKNFATSGSREQLTKHKSMPEFCESARTLKQDVLQLDDDKQRMLNLNKPVSEAILLAGI